MKKKRNWGQWEPCGHAFAEGGQGRLYLVTDITNKFSGEYVLKELKNPKRIERFNTEINAIASLNDHDNVIKLIDSGIYRHPNKPCFVMPKADCTFNEFLKTNREDTEFCLNVFDGICEGVSYLHSQLIIHRDIKPENVLMFGDVPKVTDLGLCLLAEAERYTLSNEAVGPRFYMAPELEDGKKLDVSFEADVYSLGKVLYFILSGGRIFSREKYKEKDWRLDNSFEATPLKIFDTIFDKSITVDPSSRYENASDLQIAFRDAFSRYRSHPITTLLKKHTTLKEALESEIDSFSNFNLDELKVLLNYAKDNEISVEQSVLNIVCDKIDGDSAKVFTEIILENISKFDRKFLAHAAKKILSLIDTNTWFDWWLRRENFSRVVKLLLNDIDPHTLNIIALRNIIFLKDCVDVHEILADNFFSLSLDAMHNFLLASVKSPYKKKEMLLLELSNSQNLDPSLLSLVVGGLCACGTPESVKRVHTLAEVGDTGERVETIGKGMVLGASSEAIVLLKKFDWSNQVLKVMIDVIDRAHNSKDNHHLAHDNG